MDGGIWQTEESGVGPADRLLKPWLDHLGTTEYDYKEQRLHDEIVAFTAWVKPTSYERTARELVVSKIRELIHVKFPYAEVSLFGSVAQDLSLPNGDLDLVMHTPDVYDKKDAVKALFSIASVFKSSRLTYRTRVIPQARVPIITFETVPLLASLQADICVNQEDGLKAISIIRGYLDDMPALRPLVLVLKVYMAIQNLNSPAFGGLGSYATICMVITFLKANPLGKPASYIDRPMASESLGYLLLDFFQFFGFEFPYETSYLCPATGQILPKESAEWVSKSRSSSLAIECLINPGRDIGKSASKIELIKIAFQDAYLDYRHISSRCRTATY
ncbi:hypothetical protein QCA50_002442 [Cerrena zonata]|uniref:polynucleotide adenylyltransferase n=1 Tax=Cerrena zonata TaxID=2478898 RepID=A0AAW0GTG3_9APHY